MPFRKRYSAKLYFKMVAPRAICLPSPDPRALHCAKGRILLHLTPEDGNPRIRTAASSTKSAQRDMLSNRHVWIREGNRRGDMLEASHSSDGPGSVSLFLEAPCQEGMGSSWKAPAGFVPLGSPFSAVIMWRANNDRLHLCPQDQRAAPGSRTST